MSEAVRGSALILAIALATTGCSRDDSNAAPGAPDASPLVSSVAEPAASAPAVSQPPALPSALDVALAPHTGDLDEIVKRRQIRMLVTIDRTHFFFDGAVQKGVVADAVKEFDQWLNKTLKRPKNSRIQTVVVPVRRDQLLPALQSGRGDVIAVYVTDTPERRKQVAFADAGFKVNEVFVANAAAPPPTGLDDLAGREVWVRRGGIHHDSLTRLNEQFDARKLRRVDIRELDATVESDEALEMVNAGVIPATVADRYVARLWTSVLPEMRVYEDIRLRVDAPFTWAVRKDSPQLQALVGQFQKTHGEGTLWGNMKFKEYFVDGRFIRNPGAARDAARFRQTRSLFERYAGQYSLDWLLITAQGYQESGLDQAKRSHVGAIGVMQVMPATARDPRIAIPEIQKVDRNIEAGVKYLRMVIDEYYADEPMSQVDKMLFALASYNAGPARVAKLRAEAAKVGLDPNVWFENVEIVAARRIGAETVTYVRNIHKYYIAYKLLEEQGRLSQQAHAHGSDG
jgi:membrane-bound lytic murein transglycosylase MltF